jgi:hypothetical protein
VRLVVGLLTLLSLGALAPALANDPAPVGTTPSAPSDATSAPASGASTSASSTPAAPNATPGNTQPGQSAPSGQSPPTGQTPPTGQAPPASSAATGATSTAAAKSAKPELTPAEKDLLSQGYKLEMRGTDKHFCRNEAELGSRFPRKVCLTPEQAAATKRSSQDFLNDVQRPSNNQPGR